MASSSNTPQIIRLGEACDPFRLFEVLPSREGRALLESARTGTVSGRYSFVASGALEVFSLPASKRPQPSMWEKLRGYLNKYPAQSEGTYPFTGGLLGYLSYECKDAIESTLSTRTDADGLPPLAHFSVFDHAVIIDHLKNETLLAVADLGPASKNRAAKLTECYRQNAERSQKNRAAGRSVRAAGSSRSIEASWDRRAFRQAVQRAKEYIRRGDVFQVNLAQRLRFPVHEPAGAIYQRLRTLNPSPFFGIYDTGDFQLLSGSPERLLKLGGRLLETRPIAGTRARGKNEAEDSRIAQDLILSPKERAEHVMLVDLERNDMGRVAEYGSVDVDELMVLENYSHVKHIVSNVRAVLKDGLDAVDAIRAFFPGGTITGAPKIRSMQIIDELEPVRRGPYTGSLGYLGFSGNMDMNILIRSLVIKDGMASLHVGAGIVADSTPEKEYEETLHKAEAVLCAVFGKSEVARFFGRCGLKR